MRTGTLRTPAVPSVEAFALDPVTQSPHRVTGWHAKHLLLCDTAMPTHKELLRMDCGSWHRVHDVSFDADGTRAVVFVYVCLCV